MMLSVRRNQRCILVVLAMVAFAGGALVYALDRPAGSTAFIPAIVHISQSRYRGLGLIGASLPSLVHVYCFILLTAVLIRQTRRNILLTCLAWFLIEVSFEVGQLPFMSRIASRSDVLDVFLGGGVFDWLDLLAIGLGTTAAFVTVTVSRPHQKEGHHVGMETEFSKQA